MIQRNDKGASNVASLQEARKRAAQKAKAEKKAARPGGPRTTRDWLIGGLLLAMALGFIGSLMLRASQMFGGGA